MASKAILYKYHDMRELEECLLNAMRKKREGFIDMTLIPLYGPQFAPETGEPIPDCGYLGVKKP